MASITIKDIPGDLHALYKRRARKNGRSLQAEILAVLRDQGAAPADGEYLEVDEVAGMLESRVKGVSVEELNERIDEMFRETWKR